MLDAALADCTSASVRIYCHPKEWDLKNVHAQIELIDELFEIFQFIGWDRQ